MIQLAVRTGIAPSVWAVEGERAIMTALEVLNEERPQVNVERGADNGKDSVRVHGPHPGDT